MIIETKYNIGDEVWGIPNGEPVKLVVTRIYVKIHAHKIGVSYEFDVADDRTTDYQRVGFSPPKKNY